MFHPKKTFLGEITLDHDIEREEEGLSLNKGVYIGFMLVTALGFVGAEEPPNFDNMLRPDSLLKDVPPRWAIADRMAYHKVPGVAVAVLKNGRVVDVRGFGVLEAGGDERVDGNTVFSVGSVSKMAAAALTLKLVEAGLLDLDRNVDDYLTSWKTPKSDLAPKTGVTLRMLMSHTAGFNIHGFPDFYPGQELPTAVQTLTGEAPSRTGPLQFLFSPGERYKYSGGGITVEQLVISDAVKEAFEEVARKRLFQPAKMTRSTFQNPLPASHGNIARAHDSMGKPTAKPRGWEAMPEMAASGLWTSAADLGRFTALLIQSYQSDGGFLKRELAMEMMTEVAPSWHGLGPRLNGEGRTRYFHHGGSNNSYKAWMEGHLETGDGLVVLTNGANGHKLHQEIRNAVADAYDWEINRLIPAKPLTIPQTLLSQFEGEFRPDPAFPTTLRGMMVGGFYDAPVNLVMMDGALKLKRTDREGSFNLAPLAPNRYIISHFGRGGNKAVIQFHRNVHGRVTSFSLRYNDFISLYKKTEKPE